uniref:Envelope glycoprotein n=1 Tax=Equine infectious anemia virus TaxID=11665 RepID=O36322_9RETR|nr:envelope protein [Equine infectious anemia virus]
MVSIAFYGGIPGGISTPITQQSEKSKCEEITMFQPYCYNNDSKNSMAESKEARDQEMNLKEESKEERRRNDWWKIGMFLLCLAGTTGGILWWYEGLPQQHYIGLVAIGGRLNGSGQSNAIECWGSFPGCRPFQNYFSYETNRSMHIDNNTATLLEAYHREITFIYKSSCTDSDHCQEYQCKKVNLNSSDSSNLVRVEDVTNTTEYWGFKWLECNQTENFKTILVPENEMVNINDTDTWIPKGCNETWARVKRCPIDILYGIHPIRLCVQPPFFLVQEKGIANTSRIGNCGPTIFLGVLEDNKGVVRGNYTACNVSRLKINRKDYTGIYQVPIFYTCNFTNITSCNNEPIISVIMYETNQVQYLLCNNNNSNNYNCVVQSFGVIGQAHLELPRPNKRIRNQNFNQYNCSINNKTELETWKLVKTSGITPLPISSEANTGLIRHKRDFGISAIVAAIVAATAIAASATMSYVALTEVNKIMEVQNHTFEVENSTLNGMDLIERQIKILYAMILQTHADVQLLKERQQVEETFNLIGCIERTHVFCHTGHPWNMSWGHLNESTQWDDWVSKMEDLNQEILTILHGARNNLAQSMITFNTPDSIAQFGKDLWSHIGNWIPGLGASIIKYIVMFLLIYLLLTSSPKILRALWKVTSGAGSSGSRYLKKKFHHKHASREDTWDQAQHNIHLAGVTGGSGDKYYKQKCSRNDWNGESEEYNRRPKSWVKSIEAFGESYISEKTKGEISQPGAAINEHKNGSGGNNPHQGSLDLEIRSEGGNIYDCCIKAQEGTLAIPCCGFPLWLFWGLVIIVGRIAGYGLRGLAVIIRICIRGLNLIFEIIRKMLDYIGRALNPGTSHVSMPQYV